MFETTKLYILLSVWITLTVLPGGGLWKLKKKFGVHFLGNVAVDVGETQYVATACWFVEAYAKSIVNKQYSKQRTQLL